MRLGRRKAERERQVQRYWDALVTGASPDDLARLAAPLDPSLIALIARVRATHQRRPPDPAFVNALERGIMDAFTRTQTVPIPLRPTLGDPRGASDLAQVPGGRLLDTADSRRRSRFAQLAAALLIAAALVGIYFAFVRDTYQPAIQPTTIPAPTVVSTVVPTPAPSVSMYRADPARTGQMPGPGPTGDPVELWRVQFQGRLEETAPAIVDGIAYLGSPEGVFVALEAATGRERWRIALPIASNSQPTVAHGVVYVCGGEGDLVALDAATGAERWRVPTDEPAFHLVAGDTVYLGDLGSTLLALDAATGAERWRAGGIAGVRAISADGGTLFVAAVDGLLHALDAATGGTRWTFQTDTDADVLRMPAVADGMVYLPSLAEQGAADGQLYAVDASTGTERWRFAAPSDRGGFFPVAVGGGTVYVPSDDGSVYALDAATGEQRWSFATGAINRAAPALVGDTLYVVGQDRRLFALDAATGAELWQFAIEGGSSFGPVVAGGVVFKGTALGVFVALGAAAATPAA